jgi:F0F1-type ATP synthase assembly protein I
MTTKDGGGKMADKRSSIKKKPYGKAILFGIVVAVLYVTLLTHQGLITANFTRGGLYALLPIATAFVFSFFHGSFTSAFWTVLGVEAKKKKEVK